MEFDLNLKKSIFRVQKILKDLNLIKKNKQNLLLLNNLKSS